MPTITDSKLLLQFLMNNYGIIVNNYRKNQILLLKKKKKRLLDVAHFGLKTTKIANNISTNLTLKFLSTYKR